MDDVEIHFLTRAERERRWRRDIKELAKELIEELCPLMVAPRRSSAIPIEINALCTLHFYAQGSYQKSAGNDTNLRLCQSNVSFAVEEVTAALNTSEMLIKWICFPHTQVERGDSGYPHQPWLQTPILNAPDDSPEAKYILFHVWARSTVEQCIGLLKATFRCLLKNRVLEYAPFKCRCIVHACIVLKNQ
ncbi:hypothetical protein J437_LFUL017330 [Ladona fulva]|uniref:DDE Tnp4 domain-containing protein n=1 Tax=Ladona fulva TaxID=123851 RepID=A0A8K0KNY6_LADFU|nr:hypothetical protein J437_LFUL017330 [Ladona fulva]